jgi:hypothetical protein
MLCAARRLAITNDLHSKQCDAARPGALSSLRHQPCQDSNRLIGALPTDGDTPMSESYLTERADTCRRLASEEDDVTIRDLLYHLENDYRIKARHARRHEQVVASQQHA